MSDLVRGAHDLADVHGIPVDGCACDKCEATRLLMWSQGFLAYCRGDDRTRGGWR